MNDTDDTFGSVASIMRLLIDFRGLGASIHRSRRATRCTNNLWFTI